MRKKVTMTEPVVVKIQQTQLLQLRGKPDANIFIFEKYPFNVFFIFLFFYFVQNFYVLVFYK